MDSRWLGCFTQDLHYAARQLRFQPGFTAAAVLSLALGLGANMAIFQLLNAVRLRNLPVKDPQGLVEVRIDGGPSRIGVSPGWPNQATYALWEQIRDHHDALAEVFAWGVGESVFGEGDQQRRIRSLWVTGTAFSTLGVPPYHGQLLTEQYERPACDRTVVVISHGFWRRELGGQETVIGSRVTVDGRPVTVLGITPPAFFGLEVGKDFDVAMPACTRWTQRRDVWWLGVFGRVKPGMTVAGTAAHLRTTSAALFEAAAPSGYDARSMETWRQYRFTAARGANGVSRLRDNYERSLWLLLGITSLVVLLACANLANLLLARAAARGRELALRAALGASRTRLLSQMLTESLLIATIGALVGTVVGSALSRGLLRFLNTGSESFQLDVGVDWIVLTFTGMATLATTVGVGLLPAIRSTRADAGATIKSGGREREAGQRGLSAQRILIASQVSLSLVLLVAAFLFVGTYRNMTSFDPGFHQEGIFSVFLDIDRLQVPQERRQAFKQELTDLVGAIPGVDAAAMSTHMPFSNNSWALGVRVPSAAGKQEGSSKFTWTSPGYFAAMGIPVLSGRDFTSRDTATSPRVLVVNEAFTRRFLQGRDPIGASVTTVAEPGFPSETYEVIGIVRDTTYRNLREPTQTIAFAPSGQLRSADTALGMLVRTSTSMPAVISSVRATLQRAVPDTRIETQVLQEQAMKLLVRERVLAWLSGVFGLLAVVLALIGIYGVISYMVTRRQREIGIRLALGASRGGVLRLVLREVAMVAAVGIAAGVVVSLGTTRWARSFLFGLEPSNPLALTLACTAVGAIAIAAGLLPAWKAARTNPVSTLRTE